MRASFPTLAALVALFLGLGTRLLPAFLGQPALSTLFMTEDGYLMQTVARNMAIGLGMTVSDGTIPTNGVQPMATFLFTIPYLITGGDKVTSLIGIHLIAMLAAFAGALAARSLAELLLRPQQAAVFWPWMVAALWFLSPIALMHSMNGLETGVYTLVILLTLLQFARVLALGARARALDRLLLGISCGLVFFARNDAIFLVAAIFIIWALDEMIRTHAGFRNMLTRLVPPGLLSLAIAAPWLINNKLRFGSIVPISGKSQSLGAEFGQNASLLPAKIFEYLFPMLPIPRHLETLPVATWSFSAIAAVVLSIFVAQLLRRGGPVVRCVFLAYLIHVVAIAIYYGFYFGASHFMSRYLAPAAPLMIIATLSVLLDLGRWILPRRPDALAYAYGIGGLVLATVLVARLLMQGEANQGHIQVVRWVEENVPQNTWIGAPQTGTLGYWHDRTINLDGKVNPAALEARRSDGHVLAYVTASQIDYIVDWASVGVSWIKRPEGGFAEAFDLVLLDEARNLSVLKRRDLRQP